MNILVFAEQRENKFKKPAFEAVRTARSIADQLNGEVIALVVGGDVQSIAPTLGGYGAQKVLIAEEPRLAHYASRAYARLVADATAMGKDLAPRVAVKLDAGLASDCTALNVEGNEIVATRPIYAGKALTQLRVNSTSKVFTLRPNVFAAGESTGAAAPVERMSADLTDQDLSCVAREIKHIIVTGGRGLKGPEHFAMIEQLAEALGAAVGASRAVVDAGWRPHDEQVGQTGKTVSPSLYVAVAVSGAIQHLAGMSSSKYIVAINKDKDAPIFQAANYGIVGDAFEIIPALTAEVKKLLGKN
jgi:electron transfer flavoprotein alpha subunit